MRVFVDERPTDVAENGTVRDAIAAYDRALVAAVEAGAAYATDGVGRDVALDAPLAPGSILRVRHRARGREAR